MKRTLLRIPCLLALLALLVLAALPAPVSAAPDKGATAAKLTIANRTKDIILIALTGPAILKVTATPGNTITALPAGEYTYSYTACGKQVKGKVKTGAKLTIAPCLMVRITVLNLGPGTLRLVFSGPQTYTFNLPVGKSGIAIMAGRYTINASLPCGANKPQTIDLLKKGKWVGVYGCTRQ